VGVCHVFTEGKMFDFKKKENLIKIGAGLLIIISWAVLIGWKIKNPDINLRNPLIIAGIITVLSIVAFFSQKLFKRGFKSEEDVPEPLSQEEVERKIRKEFEDKFWSHIKINGGFNCIKTKTINKNMIYAYLIESIYEINFRGKKENSLIAIINANYQKLPITFKEPKLSEHLLEKEMNNKSFNPKEEPDEEESEESIDSFGKPVRRTKKRTHTKEKKEEKADIE